MYYMVNHAVSTICRVQVHTVQVSAILTSVRLKVLVESELVLYSSTLPVMLQADNACSELQCKWEAILLIRPCTSLYLL